jgi:hypothetical protein
LSTSSSKVQAKDIPDDALVDLVKALQGAPIAYIHGGGREVEMSKIPRAMFTDICNLWSTVPPKVIQTKLKKLVERGLIDGCACGCRGEFTVIEQPKPNIVINIIDNKRCICH